nr:hypothetical protein [Acidobacteriota bacterium]
VADEALAVRLGTASRIVAGRVVATRPLAVAEADEGEHAAEWVKAEIALASTEKGESGTTATVYFAGAGEEVWRHAPKLQPGDAGLFLLQPYSGADLPPGSLVVSSPLDVQHPSQTGRVRRLLNLPRPAAAPRR